MGITGACRCDELVKLTIDNVEDQRSILIIRIPDSKTKIERTFVVDGKTTNGLNLGEIYRKYAALRPTKVDHRRFFVLYKNGKCTSQVVGKNTYFGKSTKYNGKISRKRKPYNVYRSLPA